MSADNGIYILKTKDQYRVIHAQAIENLYYSPLGRSRSELVPTRLVEYYGKTRYTRNAEIAHKVAFAMLKNTYICEYGISEFSINKTWKQIVREAKELAPKEIEYYKNGKQDSWSKNQIERLEEVLSMQ